MTGAELSLKNIDLEVTRNEWKYLKILWPKKVTAHTDTLYIERGDILRLKNRLVDIELASQTFAKQLISLVERENAIEIHIKQELPPTDWPPGDTYDKFNEYI